MPLPSSGNIQDVPLPALFEELGTRKFTGNLVVRSDDAEKTVHLKEGQIVFATSTDSNDRLGEILIKAGKLTRERLETALALLKKTAGFKKLGALLVEKGFVTPKDLFTGLKTQVKEIIYSLFLLENATYHIEETLPTDIIQLQINMQELITEIIQRIRQEA